jgi:hypothetical protein
VLCPRPVARLGDQRPAGRPTGRVGARRRVAARDVGRVWARGRVASATRRGVLVAHDRHRHRRAATARGGAAATSGPTLPPSFVQRSSSRRASALPSSATACASRRTAIARNLVGGASSDAHWVPQRQHESSWRAIGARQERHRRGTCRSLMAQRSCPRADGRSPTSPCSIEGRLFRGPRACASRASAAAAVRSSSRRCIALVGLSP